MTSTLRFVSFVTAGLAIMVASAGCPDPETANANGHCDPKAPRTEVVGKWLKRASEEYRNGDLAEAADSIGKAQNGAPCDPEVRLLAARIGLAKLDYEATLKALDGVAGSEASGLRARAYWYRAGSGPADDLGHAAEELSSALDDPDYKDPWAKPVRELAGTQGSGRKPFTFKDSSARLVEIRMPRDLGYALMVPCEIDGQATVALAVTGVPEVVLDTKGRSNPGWVTIKFTGSNDRSIEVRDVPALVQDLSKYTAQQQVPVGAILGLNLLRRLHVTFDRRGDQFIIRRDEPPPPPAVTKVPIINVRGGRMVVRTTLRDQFELTSGVFVNSGESWPLALPDATWKKLGVNPSSLQTYAGVQHGKLPGVRIGPLDVGAVESVAGITGVEDEIKALDVDAVGALGMGFLTAFRVTLAEGGRVMWLETDNDSSSVLAPPVPTSSPPPKSTAPAPTGSAAPKPSAAPSTKPPASAPAPAPKPSSAPPPVAPPVAPKPAVAPAPSGAASGKK